MASSLGYSPELLSKPSLGQRLHEKLAASRFLTFSILIHVVVLAVVGGLVIATNLKEEDFPAPAVGTMEETSAPPPRVDPTVIPPTFQAPAPRTTSSDLLVISSQREVANVVPLPQPATPMKMAKEPQPPEIKMPRDRKNLGLLPTSMTSRAGGKRAEAMKMNGGKPSSEKAVLAGLRWLKAHQNPDGSWSGPNAPAMTGLAVLCYLGHGEMPQADEFGPTVKRGLDWILERGTASEGRLGMSKVFSNAGVYEHAICTYALAEYYTLSGDERVKDLLTRAVAYIVDGQAPDGGWQYGYAKGPDSDTSVTGWQIQALKAAHLTGLNLPGVDAALDKAMLDLKRVQGPKGGFGYKTAQDRYSLTGAGVLCTYFWKGEKDKSVRDGVSFIIDETEKAPLKYDGPNADLYAWYYHTQACLMYGGPAWAKWNRWFQDELINSQQPDGSWPATGSAAGALQNQAEGAGPFYRTTLCVLMLEVFYRYMPTGKR